MSRSLHARKHIAKLTALPNCSNMGGAGGFTGSAVGTSKLCHTRNRHGKRKDCVILVRVVKLQVLISYFG